MVIGLLNVVNQAIWVYIQAERIWGANKELETSEEVEIKRGILKWFGQKVIWGSIEASILLQVFYRLSVGLEG